MLYICCAVGVAPVLPPWIGLWPRPPRGAIGACRCRTPGSVAQTIARQRQFNQGQSLGGTSIVDLRDQGRR